ncbi:Protein with carboxyl methyl esterase activity [Ceratobasidium sp. 414]|nr:Protein with carboxyl methyl esterase activity [Ceratobasidium sp. 414]
MSALQRSAMSTRVAGLPRPPPPQARAPWAFPEDTLPDEEEEEEDGLGELPPVRIGPTQRPTTTARTTQDFSPISAAAYLSQAVQVSVPASNLDFRVYYTAPTAPGPEGTVLVCHHGAGYSSLSFACFAKAVGELSENELGILRILETNLWDLQLGESVHQLCSAKLPPSLPDLLTNEDDLIRCIGKTTPQDPSDPNADVLDLGVIASDMVNLLSTVFPDPASAPSIVLLGHSMGGTAVVHACPKLQEGGYRVAGVAVLDVVEGSAMEALPHMHKLLESRPEGFASVEEAIEWHLKNNTIRNPTSARVSVPSLVVPAKEGETPAFKWRTPLRDTSPYWTSLVSSSRIIDPSNPSLTKKNLPHPGWFTGLSESFLAARAARLLVLAGTDRLDKTLMIGQMQGKFQMVVVPDVGHMLHEDNPERLAEITVEFWRRNERVVAGIKKVGEQ